MLNKFINFLVYSPVAPLSSQNSFIDYRIQRVHNRIKLINSERFRIALTENDKREIRFYVFLKK